MLNQQVQNSMQSSECVIVPIIIVDVLTITCYKQLTNNFEQFFMFAMAIVFLVPCLNDRHKTLHSLQSTASSTEYFSRVL